MTDRASAASVVVLAVALVGINLRIKPGLDRTQIDQAAAMFGAGNAWHGRVAHDFELPRLRDDAAFHLADHVGREVVIVNFFATWCGPCRAEMPELQRYVARLERESKKVALVAVDAQEKHDLVDAFARDLGLEFPIAIDDDGSTLKAYGVDAYPTTVVIGADGHIKLYQSGAIFNADVAFDAVLAPELRAIAEGHGISREAYLNASQDDVPPPRTTFRPSDTPESGTDALTGRAKAIAEAMPCPCGCEKRVAACTCQTATGIKNRLRAGVDANLSDGKVMEKLNKEFCMKGM